MFRVSFARQNVLTAKGRWLFPKAHRDRFEWIALLAYRRATFSHDGGWLSLDDIARLPRWTKRTRRHIGNNVGRYLQDLERLGIAFEAKSVWAGPYRLAEEPGEVSFDIPLAEVEKQLRIAPSQPEVQRDDLIRFVSRFVRAQLLFHQGRLASGLGNPSPSQSALIAFTELVRDFPANPRLQLIALIAAARVQFRLGRFGSARETLIQYEAVVRQVGDKVLEAQYYLSLAWSYRRAESGTQSNQTVETMLSKARECASNSGDRGSLGLLAYRTGWALARKTRYEEALAQMSFAVEAALITSDIASLQAYCADLGSIAHRIGPRRYREARKWILTGILLARWGRLGRDDAHGEMILGKMYCDLDAGRLIAALWLQRAERVAKTAGNAVNLADIHMVWGFWQRRYGTRKDLIETLGRAIAEFRRLRNFDFHQKERYIIRKFPSVSFQVLAFAKTQQPKA